MSFSCPHCKSNTIIWSKPTIHSVATECITCGWISYPDAPGIPKKEKRAPLTKAEVIKAVRLFEDGVHPMYIAEMLGCSTTQITDKIKAYNKERKDKNARGL